MRKLEFFLAGGLLALLPFSANPYMPLETAKNLAVFVLGNLVFCFLLARDIHWVIGAAHLGFVGICCITGFGSMQLYPYCYWTASLIFSLWFLRQKRDTQEGLLLAVVISGVLSSVYALWQVIGTDPIFVFAPGIDPHQPIAFFGQTTKFGAFAAPVAAMAFAVGRWQWSLAGLFVAIMALTTGSSFTILALGAGVLICVGHHHYGRWLVKRLFLGGLVACSAAWALFPKASIFFPHGRFELWAEVLDAWKQAPSRFFGWGPGSMQAEVFSQKFQSEGLKQHGGFLQAHNDYLQVLFDSGYWGAAYLALVLFFVFRSYYRHWWMRKPLLVSVPVRMAQAYLAGMLANAIGNFPWQLAPHYLVGILCIAIILKDDRAFGTISTWPQLTFLRLPTSLTKCVKTLALPTTLRRRR